ncbi:MAG TPA: hypothetical protein VN829_02330 [Dongiaceae bacterium]|nr:hypothetical protein [Dongiaceae bacterium]
MRTRDQACRKCREALRLDAAGALPEEQRSVSEKHLAHCTDCQAYSKQLRAAAEGLKQLSWRAVRPSANFRERWTGAVESSGRPGSLAQAVAELIERGRLMVWRNRRALAALAPVWVLILVFKLTAPDVGKPPPATMACSPVEVFRKLKAGNGMQTALGRMYEQPASLKDPAASPRSSCPVTQPVTFRRESQINFEATFLS